MSAKHVHRECRASVEVALAQCVEDSVGARGSFGFFHECQPQKALRLRIGGRCLAAMEAGEFVGGASAEEGIEDGVGDEEGNEDGGDCECVRGHCVRRVKNERIDWNRVRAKK